jgi:hypothetical protein
MIIQLDRRFQKRVQGMFGKYQFEVGVLEDGPHYLAKRGERGKKGQDVLKNFAGGPARKQTRKSTQSIAEVSESLRKNLGFNYLTKPFESSKNADILAFTNAFFKLVFGRTQQKRAENLLQAIVRNPMLRGDYGNNSPLTQAIKGFNRKTIDTAQLFKAIRARCRTKAIFGGSK